MQEWKFEDARKQFSKLMLAAQHNGPQIVTQDGREEVVVLAIEEYRRLRRQQSLVAFMRESPLADAFAAGELELVRSRDQPRDFVL